MTVPASDVSFTFLLHCLYKIVLRPLDNIAMYRAHVEAIFLFRLVVWNGAVQCLRTGCGRQYESIFWFQNRDLQGAYNCPEEMLPHADATWFWEVWDMANSSMIKRNEKERRKKTRQNVRWMYMIIWENREVNPSSNESISLIPRNSTLIVRRIQLDSDIQKMPSLLYARRICCHVKIMETVQNYFQN